jgi:hypothetical protein|tara:strand:+ start:51698 stop:52018 length:321 start_codon:yes stop_codon:yes gene_type:complete
MLFDIEVRPGNNTEFFQYYSETVEALTSHDAVARVQRANPGCQVRCTNSYNADNSGSSISSMGEIGSYLILGAIIFALWLIVEYWWIALPAGLIALGAWILKLCGK